MFQAIARAVNNNFESQVDFLSRLVKTDSSNPFTPSDSKPDVPVEKAVAELIFHKLAEFGGCAVKEYGVSKERPNIVCEWGTGSGRKSIMFNGHMDTIPVGESPVLNPFSGAVRNGKIYGLGVLDMKASLSAYIFALKALIDAGVKLPGKMILAFVVDEEVGGVSSFGTKLLLEAGVTAKACIIGKPGTENIAIGHRGCYRFRLKVKGQGVHTGVSEWEKGIRGKNAIVDMAKAITALKGLDIPYKPAKIFSGRKPMFTFPTKISGGTAVNLVPEVCEAFGDVRLMPGNSDKQVKLLMVERLKPLGIDFEIDDLLFVPAVEIETREEVVEALASQAEDVLKTQPRFRGVGPGNDAWMMIKRDIPTVAGFGPDGGGNNGYDEWVDLESLKKVTEIYARTAMVYLSS